MGARRPCPLCAVREVKAKETLNTGLPGTETRLPGNAWFEGASSFVGTVVTGW